jgi:hypothetical protein
MTVNKKRIGKLIRNIIIAVVVMLVLFIGVGVAYVWISAHTQPPVSTVAPPDTNPTPVIKHVEASANVPEGASVQSITSPVIPGDNASVIVKTNPGSWCTITVVYDKTASTDSGLKGKTADEFGSVSWTWTVSRSATLGKWPVTITCLRNKLSAVVVGDLVVQKTTSSAN